MYLSRLYIENYRSIQKAVLKFEPGKNVIVGRNNSGKSNILKAIDLVLGEYSPTYNKSENITDNDFFASNTNKPIFIWCEIQRERKDSQTLENIDFSNVCKTAFSRIYADNQRNFDIRVKVSSFKKKKNLEFLNLQQTKPTIQLQSSFSLYRKTNSFFNSSLVLYRGQARIDNGEFFKKWIGGKPLL